MRIRFISKNEHKIAEASAILGSLGIEIVPVTMSIAELQTDDMVHLVHDKTLRAFGNLGHPVFVEQTGLFLDRLGGFPGGLTQVFWDRVGADRMCELFGHGDVVGVVAKTRIGFCDGRHIHQFEGEVRGRVAEEPRGDRSFQWDCVFIPEGYDQTFAEMGDLKNQISMRRRALDLLLNHLRERADV